MNVDLLNSIRKTVTDERNLNAEIKEYEKNIEELEKSIKDIELKIANDATVQQQIDFCNEQLKKNPFILSLFSKKTRDNIRYYEQQLEYWKQKLPSFEPLQQELENKTELKKYYNDILANKNSLKTNRYEGFSINDDDILIIDGDNSPEIEQVATKNQHVDRENDMLVHSTSFFPNNRTILTGKSGHKIDKFESPLDIHREIYNGVHKGVVNYSTRETVHTVVNGCVEDHGYGNFGKEFLVLEPSRYHIGNLFGGTGDTWLRGDIKLSDECILLVEESTYSKLTSEQKSQYNIVVYRGDATKALSNLLNTLGYPSFEFYSGDKGHSLSFDMIYEVTMKKKNMILSLYSNKQMVPTEEVSLIQDDLVKLYDIWKNTQMHHAQSIKDHLGQKDMIDKICEKNGIEPSTFYFFLEMNFKLENEKYVNGVCVDMEKVYNESKTQDFSNLEKIVTEMIESNDLDNLQLLINNQAKELNDSQKDLQENMMYNEINSLKNVEYERILADRIKQIFTELSVSFREPTFCFNGIQIVMDHEYEFPEVFINYSNDKFWFYSNRTDEYSRTTSAFVINCENLTAGEILNELNNYVMQVKNNMAQLKQNDERKR